MKIRKAVETDAEKSYELLESEKEKGFTANDFRNASKHKDAIFLVAENDKGIIGYVIGFICPTKKTDAMLAETRVKESERKMGIGSRLIDAFCKEAFRMGAKTVYAEVKKKDSKFYGKNRFKKANEWIEMARKR